MYVCVSDCVVITGGLYLAFYVHKYMFYGGCFCSYTIET